MGDKNNRALVIFSGGQDSTTCLFWALENFEFVTTLTFSYGQRHIIELESAKKIAQLAQVKNEMVDFGKIFSGISSLTDNEQNIPEETIKKRDAEKNSDNQLPTTFVPGRNILFLSVAGSRAYTANCDNIVIGVSQEDFAGYPDCRESFIKSMEQSLSNGLDRRLSIHSPLMNLSKKETVELAMKWPECMKALSFSTTCYNGKVPPCGRCNSCQLRARGFEEAGIEDPLVKRTSSDLAEVKNAGK